ncbi:hypothetical protein DIE11_04650 [Burkholderia sp. Bp9012]|uniref:hypothetical protein n=1 Tax=Burkholderia sp. Bp9012 TaxID=2184562 RepID=UPI000F5B4706|nr:hypothetical protein [Burkholderia sp. Bp9012]RQR85316.1 hypothetical protein DIE11_04650 [Burkholderia sp. Bp9012]
MLREIGVQYVTGPIDEELFRGTSPAQTSGNSTRSKPLAKQAEHPSWLLEETLCKVEAGVQCKVSSGQWDVSLAEIAWVIRRVRQLLAAAGVSK